MAATIGENLAEASNTHKEPYSLKSKRYPLSLSSDNKSPGFDAGKALSRLKSQKETSSQVLVEAAKPRYVTQKDEEKTSRLTFSSYNLIKIEQNKFTFTNRDSPDYVEVNPIIAQFKVERSMGYLDSLTETSEISQSFEAPNKDPQFSVLYQNKLPTSESTHATEVLTEPSEGQIAKPQQVHTSPSKRDITKSPHNLLSK